MDLSFQITEPTYIIQNTLVVYDNVISPEMCKTILSTVSDGEYEKSITYWDKAIESIKSTLPEDYVKPNYRISNQVFISGTPKLKELDHALFKLFDFGVKKYIDLMIQTGLGICLETSNALIINEDDGYVLLKYTPGGKYDIHYDQAVHENKTKGARIVSSILYLNDDFQGGETYFKYQDYTVQPKPGRLVFFPSTYTHPHAALPIKEGVKYAVVTWFR
jgi:hypothetical protein